MTSEIKPISGVDDRVALAEAIPLATPFTLNVFPTNACNFRCNYCAQSLGTERLQKEYSFSTREYMEVSTLAAAVKQMQAFPNSFKLVSFMGHGEPLLHKNLPEMVRMVTDAKVAERIEIITNASMLTHSLSERLIQAGLSALRVSLQGITAEKYEKISNVKLGFNRFIEELKYFYSIKDTCKLFVKVVDASLADGEESLFYELFGEISDRMYVERIKPVYDGVDYAEEAQAIRMDRYGNYHEKRIVCPLPFYMLNLWPNGDVVPCDAIYKPVVLGNVYSDTLLDLWQGDSLEAFQLLQLQKQRSEHFACRRCCAPDDVSHPADVLDYYAEGLIKRWK